MSCALSLPPLPTALVADGFKIKKSVLSKPLPKHLRMDLYRRPASEVPPRPHASSPLKYVTRLNRAPTTFRWNAVDEGGRQRKRPKWKQGSGGKGCLSALSAVLVSGPEVDQSFEATAMACVCQAHSGRTAGALGVCRVHVVCASWVNRGHRVYAWWLHSGHMVGMVCALRGANCVCHRHVKAGAWAEGVNPRPKHEHGRVPVVPPPEIPPAVALDNQKHHF